MPITTYIPERSRYVEADAFETFYKPDLGDVLGATMEETLIHNPSSALARLAPDFSDDTPEMTPEQANEKYGDIGLEFDEPVSEQRAQQMYDMKLAERRRQIVMEYGPSGIGTQALKFGTAILGSVADPLNIAAGFVPSLGATRIAGALGRAAPAWAVNRGGTLASRALGGAAEGAAGAAIIEPAVYLAAQRDQLDYTAYDSFLNVTIGGIMGAGSHALARAIEGKKISTAKDLTMSLDAQSKHEITSASVASVMEDKSPTFAAGAARASALRNKNIVGEIWASSLGDAPPSQVFNLGELSGSRYLNYTPIRENDKAWIEGVVSDIVNALPGERLFIDVDGQGSTQDVRGLKSTMPEWVQDYNKQAGGGEITKKKVAKVAEKMMANKPLGKAEGRIAEALYAEARALRERNAQQILDFREMRDGPQRRAVEAEIDMVAAREAAFWEENDLIPDHTSDFFFDQNTLDTIDNFAPARGSLADIQKETESLLEKVQYDIQATKSEDYFAPILEAADESLAKAEVDAEATRMLGACMTRKG